MSVLIFIVYSIGTSSIIVSLTSMFVYAFSKDMGDIHDYSMAALCAYISNIVTIITTIFVYLLSTIQLKTAIIICIIATIFSILFFILYKRGKVECEIKNVIVRIKSEAFFDRERKEGVLKINRNRKILYEPHIKTLYKMFRISDKFETEEAKEAFIKEFVNDEVEALKNIINELAEEMVYETKLRDEEILKAYRN